MRWHAPGQLPVAGCRGGSVAHGCARGLGQVQEAIATIASRAGGPRMPDQGWTLRAQTHCQAKHRLMPCSGMLA